MLIITQSTQSFSQGSSTASSTSASCNIVLDQGDPDQRIDKGDKISNIIYKSTGCNSISLTSSLPFHQVLTLPPTKFQVMLSLELSVEDQLTRHQEHTIIVLQMITQLKVKLLLDHKLLNLVYLN